jgi:capsular exopolysaccharide synthesis family protein
LKRYFASIKQYSWVLLACTIIATIAGVLLAKSSPTVYQATTTLFVNVGAPGTTFNASGTSTASPSDNLTQATDYASEITTRAVMDYVFQLDPQLQQHRFTADDLIADTVAVPSLTGPTISITATALNRADAVLIANDVANGFQAYIQAQFTDQLNRLRGNLQTQLTSYQKQDSDLETKIQQLNPSSPLVGLYTVDRSDVIHNIDTLQGQLLALPTSIHSDVSVVQNAVLTDATPTTKTSLIVGSAAGLGIMLGIVAMLILIFFDSRLRYEEEVKSKLGMAYLGGVSMSRELKGSPTRPTDKVAQELSDIVANLNLTGTLPELRKIPQGSVLLVTSPRVAEGKTTLTAAIAAIVGRSGRSVAVIDANLRQPASHLAFGVSNSAFGLSGLLKSTSNSPLDSAVQRSNEPNVWLLPAGVPLTDPSLLLQQKLPDILAQLKTKVDLVIIDGPSLLQSADASLLARNVDGVAVVVDVRHEKLSTLMRAKELLVNLTQTPAGIIMNYRTGQSKKAPYYAAVYPAKIDAPTKGLVQMNGNGKGRSQEVDAVSTASLGISYPSSRENQPGKSLMPNELQMMLMNSHSPFPSSRVAYSPPPSQ